MVGALALILALAILAGAIDLLILEPRRLRGMQEYAHSLRANGPTGELPDTSCEASGTAEGDQTRDAAE